MIKIIVVVVFVPRIDCQFWVLTNDDSKWDWGLGIYGQRKVTSLGHKNPSSYLSLLLHCFYVLWVTRCHQLLGPSFLPLQMPCCHIVCSTRFCGCGVYENGNKNTVQVVVGCFVVLYYHSPSTSPTFLLILNCQYDPFQRGCLKLV